MIVISQPTATGQLALCSMKLVAGIPMRPFAVFMPESGQVHEFESLQDVAYFSAMHRVQLTALSEEEGYPADWEDPSEMDWTMLERMLKYMIAPR